MPCLVGCCTSAAPSAEQRPRDSLCSTDGSRAWDCNGLAAVSRACRSYRGLSQSPALLPGCLPISQQQAFQLSKKLLVSKEDQQQLSPLLKPVAEEVLLSPPLLILGRYSFKLAIQKI